MNFKINILLFLSVLIISFSICDQLNARGGLIGGLENAGLTGQDGQGSEPDQPSSRPESIPPSVRPNMPGPITPERPDGTRPSTPAAGESTGTSDLETGQGDTESTPSHDYSDGNYTVDDETGISTLEVTNSDGSRTVTKRDRDGNLISEETFPPGSDTPGITRVRDPETGNTTTTVNHDDGTSSTIVTDSDNFVISEDYSSGGQDDTSSDSTDADNRVTSVRDPDTGNIVTTINNPDGSTSVIETDPETGNITTTTINPDGSTSTESRTESVRDPDTGNTITNITNPDGSTRIIETDPDTGSIITRDIRTDPRTGNTITTVNNQDGSTSVVETNPEGVIVSEYTETPDEQSWARSTDPETGITITSRGNPDGTHTITRKDKDGNVVSVERKLPQSQQTGSATNQRSDTTSTAGSDSNSSRRRHGKDKDNGQVSSSGSGGKVIERTDIGDWNMGITDTRITTGRGVRVDQGGGAVEADLQGSLGEEMGAGGEEPFVRPQLGPLGRPIAGVGVDPLDDSHTEDQIINDLKAAGLYDPLRQIGPLGRPIAGEGVDPLDDSPIEDRPTAGEGVDVDLFDNNVSPETSGDGSPTDINTNVAGRNASRVPADSQLSTRIPSPETGVGSTSRIPTPQGNPNSSGPSARTNRGGNIASGGKTSIGNLINESGVVKDIMGALKGDKSYAPDTKTGVITTSGKNLDDPTATDGKTAAGFYPKIDMSVDEKSGLNVFRTYYDSGKLRTETLLKDGKPYINKTYYEGGMLRSEQEYKNGEKVFERLYDEDGTVTQQTAGEAKLVPVKATQSANTPTSTLITKAGKSSPDELAAKKIIPETRSDNSTPPGNMSTEERLFKEVSSSASGRKLSPPAGTDLTRLTMDAQNGDTILLGSGEYKGQIIVENKTLIIKGNHAGNTVLSNGKEQMLVFVGKSGRLILEDVSFRVDGKTELAVYIQGGTALITGCEAVQLPKQAIYVDDGTLSVKQCRFSQVGTFAIYGVNKSTVLVTGCSFEDAGETAVALQDGKTIEIQGSEFKRVSQTVIVQGGNPTVTIKGNRISEGDSKYHTIRIEAGSKVLLSDNIIFNVRQGMLLKGRFGDVPVVSDNIIVNTKSGALYAEVDASGDGAGVLISNNRIINAGEYGVLLIKTPRAGLTDNLILIADKQKDKSGVLVQSGASVQMDGNIINGADIAVYVNKTAGVGNIRGSDTLIGGIYPSSIPYNSDESQRMSMFFARPDMEQRLREQVIGVLGVAAPAKITDLAAVQSAYGKLEAEVKKISEEAEALASISVKVTDAIGQDLKAGVVITDDKGNVVSEPDVTSPSVVFVPHGTYIVTPTFENFTDIVIPDLKRNVTVTEGQVAVVKIEIKNSLKLSFSTQVRVSRNSYKTVERNYRKLVQLKTREEMLRLFENGNYMWSSNTVSNWYVGMNFIAAKRSGVTQEQLDRALKAAHKVYPDIVEKFRHNNQEKRMGEVMQGRLKYFILLCQILSVAGDMEDSRLLVETAYTDDALAEICMTVAAYIENRLGILGNGAVASALKGNDPRVALRAALYLHYYGLDTGDDKLIEYLNGPSSTTNPYDKKLSQYVVSVLCNIHTPAVLDAMRGVLKKSIAATDYDLINIGAYAAVYLLAYGNADDWKQVSRFKFVQDSHERQLSYLTALVKNPRVLEIWEGDYERRTSPGVMSVDFSVSDETLKKPDYWNSGVLNYVLHENLAEKLREHHTGKDEKLDVYLAYHEIAHLIPSATDLFPNGVDCNIIRFGVEESDAGSLKFLFEMRPEFVDEKLRIGVTFKRMSTIGYNINIFGGRQGTHATIYNGIKDRYLSDGGKTLIGNIFLSRDGNVISLADVGDNGMGRFNYEAKLDNRDLKELYLHIELKILDNILYLDYPLFDGHYARGLRRSDSKVVKAEESAVSNPGNPDAWIAWGKALQGTGRLTEAMQKYGKAIMLDPNKDYLWYDMADMFSARGLHEEAVNAFNGAVGIYPDNPNIWYTMASKYYMNRNYPKAADAYGKVVALDPIDELSRLWQANNLFLAGLREKADKLYASLSEGAYKERAVIMRSLIGKSTVKPVTNRKLEEHLYKGYRDLFNNQLQQAKEQFTMAVKAGRPDLLERRMAEVELESLKTLLEKAENK